MVQAAANQRKARLTNVASDDCHIVLHQILTDSLGVSETLLSVVVLKRSEPPGGSKRYKST